LGKILSGIGTYIIFIEDDEPRVVVNYAEYVAALEKADRWDNAVEQIRNAFEPQEGPLRPDGYEDEYDF